MYFSFLLKFLFIIVFYISLYFHWCLQIINEGEDEKWKVGVIVAAAAATILGMFLVSYFIWRRRTKFEGKIYFCKFR